MPQRRYSGSQLAKDLEMLLTLVFEDNYTDYNVVTSACTRCALLGALLCKAEKRQLNVQSLRRGETEIVNWRTLYWKS